MRYLWLYYTGLFWQVVTTCRLKMFMLISCAVSYANIIHKVLVNVQSGAGVDKGPVGPEYRKYFEYGGTRTWDLSTTNAKRVRLPSALHPHGFVTNGFFVQFWITK